MKDPTRIDDVLRLVRDAWAGQPDLTLPTLMAMAANQGIGWGSSDEDLMEFLHKTAHLYPPEITPATLGAGVLITTMDKGLRISLTDAHVVVRQYNHQTVVWAYDTFRATGPGFPLVITDTAGIDHRLGVTERIMRLVPAERREGLTGLTRADIGDSVYVLVLEDGATVVLSRRVEITTPNRRHLEVDTFQWEKVLSHSPLQIRLAGGNQKTLAMPRLVLLAET